jgi:hypothetical protein
MMIGRLTLETGLVAELQDDLSWRTKDAELLWLLQTMWPREDYSPGDGEPGGVILAEAHEALGGKVLYRVPITPLTEDDIP